MTALESAAATAPHGTIFRKRSEGRFLFFCKIADLRRVAADLAKIGGAKLQKIKKSLRLAFSFWFGKQ